MFESMDWFTGKFNGKIDGFRWSDFPNKTNPLESASLDVRCNTGRGTDGFILQKYVEKPHLLDVWKLLKAPAK
jgi:hypothetical protein